MKYFIPLCFLLAATSAFAKSLSITTAPWQPYINSQFNGTANDLLQQVYSQQDIELNWLTQSYELAFMQVANQQKLASFPYFKTAEREKQVLYSQPVFSVNSFIYFNRQFNPSPQSTDLTTRKVGRVAGYSYGEQIDNAISPSALVFSTEAQALSALLAGEIDFLPMTESVMNHWLNTQFEAQKRLVKPLFGFKASASMHLIAAKTPQGEAVIAQLNQLLANVSSLKSFKLQPVLLTQTPDLAKLRTSEGYPAIIAQTTLSQDAEYFTLAQGTQVLVVKWSSALLEPAKTDRIYKKMMDLSQVVILNGPLVGRELYVRNMHLELQ